jgi:hypothetical protein
MVMEFKTPADPLRWFHVDNFVVAFGRHADDGSIDELAIFLSFLLASLRRCSEITWMLSDLHYAALMDFIVISHQLNVTRGIFDWLPFASVSSSISFSSQNLLTSEQSYIILKSITKLPIDLAPTYYPTLLTIIWENPEAEAILARDFDIQVSAELDITFSFPPFPHSQMLKEYEKSAIAKKNQLLHLLEI